MATNHSSGQRSVGIARLGSIELRAHWSLLIILLLIATSIALGSTVELHRSWSAAARWTAGALSAVLLVGSIALHELAHAVAARRFGIEVPRITLFAFGGMAQMSSRPTRPLHEFTIAIVGPLASVAIGVVMLGIVQLPLPVVTVDNLTPWSYAAWIVGQANIGLAVFNLLPGTPLDGGRILHAAMWQTTGSDAVATRRAATGGKVVGGTLALIGVAMLFGIDVPWFGAGVGGVWLILIGWFIATLAEAEVRSWPIEQLAQRSGVARVTHDVSSVAPDMPLDAFSNSVLLPRGARAAIVRRDGMPVGLATLRNVLTVPEERRHDIAVGDVMTPWQHVHVIARSATIADALQQTSQYDLDHVPVVDETSGMPVGVVSSDNLASWLALHDKPQPEEPPHAAATRLRSDSSDASDPPAG